MNLEQVKQWMRDVGAGPTDPMPYSFENKCEKILEVCKLAVEQERKEILKIRLRKPYDYGSYDSYYYDGWAKCRSRMSKAIKERSEA